jgi:hypothetical protein
MVGEDGRQGGGRYSVGYGLCFGQKETKGICMGMVESALRTSNPDNPANSQEFVLYHTDVIEAYGFTNHLKRSHYVTFQAGLKGAQGSTRKRRAQQSSRGGLCRRRGKALSATRCIQAPSSYMDQLEFFRNDAMDANGCNVNNAHQTKPSFSRNQFGFALGGPIYIIRFIMAVIRHSFSEPTKVFATTM